MELFPTKTGLFDEKIVLDGVEGDCGDVTKSGGGGGTKGGIRLVSVPAAARKDGHRQNDVGSSPTEDTVTPSSSLSSISSLSTASTSLSSYIDPVASSLAPNAMEVQDNAHCTQNASLNCSTSMSSSSSSHPSIQLAEPVVLEPFNHQVGGHSSVLRFDATTLCKPVIARERKFYESKLPKELKLFVPQFRGILEVRIVDEQEGFLCLEGHKIFGSAQVLDYHRDQSQSLNNSRFKSAASSSSPGKSSSRSRSSAAVSLSSNGENVEKPARYRFRRSGSTEIPSFKSPSGNEEKSIKSNSPSAKDIKLEEDKSIKLNSPRAKDAKQQREEDKAFKSNSPSTKEAKQSEGDRSNKSNSPINKEIGHSSSSRESRPCLPAPRSQSSSSMTVNPWNVKMVQAELEKMRKKDANNKFKFLLQENAVASFRCPSIIDLKMGIRQYGDDASEEKRKRFMAKTQMSTSAKLGVRLCGLQVYHVPTKKYIYVNKYKGRHFTVDGFKRILFMFLYNGFRFRFDVVEALLAKLRELYDIVYKLTSYRFFSSSLLIGYDGHPSSPSCCQESSPSTCGAASVTEHVDADSGGISTTPTNTSPILDNKELSNQQLRQALATSSIMNKNAPESSTSSPSPSVPLSSSSPSSAQAILQLQQHNNTANDDTKMMTAENQMKTSSPLVDMKMIDFAHTTTSSFADEIVYEGPDDGYMFGLESMIRILEELKEMSMEEQQQISASFHSDSASFNANGKT